MNKIGTILHARQGLPDKEYTELLASAGFESVFTATRDIKQHEELANLFARHNLFYESIHAPFHMINELWKEGEEGEIMLQELLNSVKCCEVANVPILVVHMSAGYDAPEMSELGKYRFEKLVEYAEKKNVQIAFENIFNFPNLEWAFEHFGKECNVGFCWDCGHEYCFTQGIEFMKYFGDRLIFTHIHDNVCEPDRDQHFIPFDGAIDFEHIARQLRDSGYEGTLSLELLSQPHKKYRELSVEEYVYRGAEAAKRLAKMVSES